MDADNQQATVMNILVAHESMDDKTAYNIVKTIFDRKDDLIAVHKEAVNFKLENQKAAASPIPFHPGRAEVLRGKGRQGQLSARRAPCGAWRPTQPAVAVSDEALQTRRGVHRGRGGRGQQLQGWLGALRPPASPS